MILAFLIIVSYKLKCFKTITQWEFIEFSFFIVDDFNNSNNENNNNTSKRSFFEGKFLLQNFKAISLN